MLGQLLISLAFLQIHAAFEGKLRRGSVCRSTAGGSQEEQQQAAAMPAHQVRGTDSQPLFDHKNVDRGKAILSLYSIGLELTGWFSCFVTDQGPPQWQM